MSSPAYLLAVQHPRSAIRQIADLRERMAVCSWSCKDQVSVRVFVRRNVTPDCDRHSSVRHSDVDEIDMTL